MLFPEGQFSEGRRLTDAKQFRWPGFSLDKFCAEEMHPGRFPTENDSAYKNFAFKTGP
jgi:hypothetical protein